MWIALQSWASATREWPWEGRRFVISQLKLIREKLVVLPRQWRDSLAGTFRTLSRQLRTCKWMRSSRTSQGGLDLHCNALLPFVANPGEVFEVEGYELRQQPDFLQTTSPPSLATTRSLARRSRWYSCETRCWTWSRRCGLLFSLGLQWGALKGRRCVISQPGLNRQNGTTFKQPFLFRSREGEREGAELKQQLWEGDGVKGLATASDLHYNIISSQDYRRWRPSARRSAPVGTRLPKTCWTLLRENENSKQAIWRRRSPGHAELWWD